MKRSSKQDSYLGKDLYIGIDVHKRTYAVAVVMDGELLKKWSTAAQPKELSSQLQRYFPQGKLHSAYEAGFSGFVLHRELEKADIDSIVVNAASIEVAAHNRVKTDKRDALKIATMLAAGRLRGIRIPSPAAEAQRLLTRTRQQLVEERTAVKNKLRMKCHQFGLIDPDDRRHMSHQWMKELLAKSPGAEFRLAMETYWQVWQTLDTQIKRLEEEMEEQAKNDPKELTYRSAPGIGPTGARILSAELGDMSQFGNERQLFSYTGLTPSEHSSGDSVQRGHITRQGNSRVRHVLCEAAWTAIKKDQSLRTFFEKLYPKTGKKKAIVAVARKLVGRIRAAFRQQVLYQV